MTPFAFAVALIVLISGIFLIVGIRILSQRIFNYADAFRGIGQMMLLCAIYVSGMLWIAFTFR